MKKVKYKEKNRYNEFLSAAKVISKKISKIEGVVGILATDGIEIAIKPKEIKTIILEVL